MMTRRTFLAAPAVLAAAATPRPLMLVTADEAKRMRVFVREQRHALLQRNVQLALKAGPWSVTYHRPKSLNIGAGLNDFVSQAPYWWPDPKNPGGPYIRRDGEYFPDRFTIHRNEIGKMGEAVLALGMGAYFLDIAGSAARAALVLSTWFLDPKTRMNPNLQFGEVIVGVNTGRGAGIMATRELIQAMQGIALLEDAGGFDPAVASGVRAWCAKYLHWLTTSKNGLSEKITGNNHSTWWTTQVAALATFTGDAAQRRMAWDHYRDFLVPKEIATNGSCPREEARTRSLFYSALNQDAFSLLCRLAQMDGEDLWHFHAPGGAGVDTSFAYLAPFVGRPETWKQKQITDFDPGQCYFSGLAGVALPSPKMLALYEALPRAETPWVQFLDILIRGGRT
jgi:hypothetical protein